MILVEIIPMWKRVSTLTLALLFALLSNSIAGAAQDESGEMFNLGIVAVNCDIQAPVNITVQEEGCRPAEGVVFTVSIDMENGEGIGSCTATVADVPNPITAGCSIPIPFGASVSVNQDPGTVPAGYQIVENAQKFTAPESPQPGESGGVIFVNLLQTGGETETNTNDTGVPPIVNQLPKTGAGAATGFDAYKMTIALTLIAIVACTGAVSHQLNARASLSKHRMSSRFVPR